MEKNDPCTCILDNLSNFLLKTPDKIQVSSTGYESMTSWMPVQYSTNWPMKPISWEPVNLLGSYVPVKGLGSSIRDNFLNWKYEAKDQFYIYFNHKMARKIYAQAWIDHFTVLCLVTRPLNKREAGVDLALIQTSLFFSCKSCYCNVMLRSFYLHKKSNEVWFKARSTPASLLFKGLVTEQWL